LSRIFRILAFLFIALFLIAGIGAAGLFILSDGRPIPLVQTALIRLSLAGRDADLARTINDDTTPIRFEIASGEVPRAIASRLLDANLIADADLFVDYVRANDLDVQLEAGVYFLTRAMTIPQIAVSLTDSRGSQFQFRILEGWRMEEIAAIIDTNPYFGFTGADFLNVVGRDALVPTEFAAFVGLPQGASLEGFLYPDTYQIPAQVTPEMLRDILLTEFESNVTPDMVAGAAQQNLTLYEVVTLASIIQREAVHADEHARIASVYRNRLRDGMKLDADPTVQYAIGAVDGTWWSQITQADYTGVISPYNTYLNVGLPPSPIANPGISAVYAAIFPETTPFYYFRARCSGDGYHNFARTFEEHLANGCP
jgi:UPF0755 protein